MDSSDASGQSRAMAIGVVAGLVIGGFLAAVAMISWPAMGPRLRQYGLGPGLLVLLYLAWGGIWGGIIGAWSPKMRSALDRAIAGALVGLATYIGAAVLVGSPLIVTAIFSVIGMGFGAFIGVQVAGEDNGR